MKVLRGRLSALLNGKSLLAASVAGALGVTCIAAPTAFAIPITFGPTDYDNSAVQTFGFFRDVLNGPSINRGLDLGGAATVGCPATTCSNPGTHNALNFTGSDSNAATLGRITLYDNFAIAGANTFTGNMSLSTDILISRFNDGKGGGLLTLFNEGVGNNGLALFLTDAGNSDTGQIRLVQQTGIDSANLGSVALGSGILEDNWYRLMLDLAFGVPGVSDFTITGKVFGHTIGTDPNSLLGAQIGTTLTYVDTAPWGAGLSDPYEVGLVARGVSAAVDTSFTNFDFTGGVPQAIPEPASIALLGAGLVAAGVFRRRRRGSAPQG